MQIFATDLSDQTALDKARAGVYPESIEAEVSPARLRRFFKREDHIYRIDRGLRDACVFARQNVTTDPPFSHLDIVSCRNLLIYLATRCRSASCERSITRSTYPAFSSSELPRPLVSTRICSKQWYRGHRIYAKKQAAVRHVPVPSNGCRRLPPPDGQRRPRHRRVTFRRKRTGFCSDAMRRPGCSSTTISTFSSSGDGSAPISSRRPENRPRPVKMAREGLFLELRMPSSRPVRADRPCVAAVSAFDPTTRSRRLASR